MGLLELSILLFIVFLVLGPKRITSLLRALGRGVRDFKTEFGRDRKTEELQQEDQDPEIGSRKDS